MNVIIFHGTTGNPEENWFPWLKRELEKKGIEVVVPKFPTPEGQSLKAWLAVFEEYENKVNEETVMVGHSMGPGMILRLLEKRDKPIKQAILAAPFYKMIGNEYFDNLNKTFIEHPFDWGKIKGKAKQFVVLAGDNDPYVPVEQTKFIAEKLGADFKLIKNGGHLNASAGFLKFEEVLREIVLLI
jgi:uncharacterized protein